MISGLYKYGMTISERRSEQGIAKSTINGRIKANKELKISKDDVITLKEVARLKKLLGLKRKIKY